MNGKLRIFFALTALMAGSCQAGSFRELEERAAAAAQDARLAPAEVEELKRAIEQMGTQFERIALYVQAATQVHENPELVQEIRELEEQFKLLLTASATENLAKIYTDLVERYTRLNATVDGLAVNGDCSDSESLHLSRASSSEEVAGGAAPTPVHDVVASQAILLSETATAEAQTDAPVTEPVAVGINESAQCEVVSPSVADVGVQATPPAIFDPEMVATRKITDAFDGINSQLHFIDKEATCWKTCRFCTYGISALVAGCAVLVMILRTLYPYQPYGFRPH